jgi:hypothetical protein
MQKLILVAAVLIGAEGRFLAQSKDGPLETGDDCGKGFDALNAGSQKYFGTLNKALWTHPYHLQQFGVFETELKCWFSNMLTTKCGDQESQAGSRKKELVEMAEDVTVDWLKVWGKFSDAEKKWFKTTYPNDEAENFATADFRQAATTALDLNKKEMLLMTLFVIDDNCVDSMYVRMS